MIRLLSISILFFLCIQSCKDRSLEMDMPNFEKKYVVESYLKDSSFYTLSLLTNVSYFEPPSLPLINNAEIYISDGRDSVKLYNIIKSETANRKFYNYRSLDTLPAKPNFFFLSIKIANGQLMKAHTIVLPKVKIDTVKVIYESDELASFYIYFQDNIDQHNFYRCIINRDSTNGREFYDRTLDDSALDPKEPLIVTGARFEPGSKYFVTLYHISEDYFKFTNSVRKANLANIDPFAQPASISNNIDGGLGIFTYLSPYTKEIRIP